MNRKHVKIALLLPMALLVAGLALAQTSGNNATNATTNATDTGTPVVTSTEPGAVAATGAVAPAVAGAGAVVPGVVDGAVPALGPAGLAGFVPTAAPGDLVGPFAMGLGAFGNTIYPYSYLGIPYEAQELNVEHTGFTSVTAPAFTAYSDGFHAGYDFTPYTASQDVHEVASTSQEINGGFFRYGTELQATNTVEDNFNTVTRQQAAQNSGSGFVDCPGMAIDFGGAFGAPNACRVFIDAPAVGQRQFSGAIDVIQGSGVNAPVVAGNFPVIGNAYNPLLYGAGVSGIGTGFGAFYNGAIGGPWGYYPSSLGTPTYGINQVAPGYPAGVPLGTPVQ